MELENIVANTVLLKAREGERAARGEGSGGLEHPCRSRPSAERCPAGLRAGPAGGGFWGAMWPSWHWKRLEIEPWL